MKKSLPYLLIALGIVSVGCGSKSDDGTTASTTPSSADSATKSPPASPVSTGGATVTGYAAVQQVFTANCRCHTGPKPKAGIDLSSYEGVIKGGGEGPIVKAGDPDSSVLIQALKGVNGKKKMPPRGDLPADAMKTITDWIQAGAKNS
jgi:protein TonB